VDIIETDVRITKDGEVIVCHDKNFERLCTPETIPSGNPDLIDLNWKDLKNLPQFKQKMPLHFAGHHENNCYERKE
jgi:glycerophosphoryl diester phosphodiesterase